MPRTARIVVPNTPHHIVQRGHNKQTVFVSDEDYQYYLENLFEWKEKLERNKKRDLKVNRKLEEEGWIVLRFWDSEIKENLSNVLKIIEKYL